MATGGFNNVINLLFSHFSLIWRFKSDCMAAHVSCPIWLRCGCKGISVCLVSLVHGHKCVYIPCSPRRYSFPEVMLWVAVNDCCRCSWRDKVLSPRQRRSHTLPEASQKRDPLSPYGKFHKLLSNAPWLRYARFSMRCSAPTGKFHSELEVLHCVTTCTVELCSPWLRRATCPLNLLSDVQFWWKVPPAFPWALDIWSLDAAVVLRALMLHLIASDHTPRTGLLALPLFTKTYLMKSGLYCRKIVFSVASAPPSSSFFSFKNFSITFATGEWLAECLLLFFCEHL